MGWWEECMDWKRIHHKNDQDWLYHSATYRCGCGDGRDNDPSTTFSRIFFAAFYLLVWAVAVVVYLRSPSSNTKDGSAQKPSSPSTLPKVRQWDVDFARIVCVACVVTEHSGGSVYADRNFAWVQQWVLPYLYTVSGVSFMFSSGSIWRFELRLFLVLAVGTCANWISDVITGRDWQHDFGNTVFQMAYVVVIGFISFVLLPLRNALRWRSKNPSAPARAGIIAWTLFWGSITTALLCACLAGISFNVSASQAQQSGGARALLEQGPYVLATYTGVFSVCFLVCWLGDGGWCTWLLLFVIYVPRMVIPYSRGGHPVNADLFAFGMVVTKIPLRGKAAVAQALRVYWPVVVTALLLLSSPGVSGRCDLHPHYDMWERVRFYFIECIFIVLFTTGAMNTADPWRITGWLGVWALYAYCFHVSWARLFPEPYGALFTYSSMPLFYALHKYLAWKRSKRLKNKQGAAEAASPQESKYSVEDQGLDEGWNMCGDSSPEVDVLDDGKVSYSIEDLTV